MILLDVNPHHVILHHHIQLSEDSEACERDPQTFYILYRKRENGRKVGEKGK